MSTLVFPDMAAAVVLNERYRNASQISDREDWGARWLMCLTYTDPRAAAREIGVMTRSTDHPLAYQAWRSKGILASLNHEFAEAAYAFGEALKRAESLGAQDKQADVLLDWIAMDLNQGDLRQADARLESAARLIRVFPRPRQTFHLLIRQAFLRLRQRQWPQAFPLFQQAERMFPVLLGQWQWDDLDYLALLYSGFGEWYTESGEREMARDAYHRVIDIISRYNLALRAGWHFLNAGTSSMALERWDEARQALKHTLELPGGSHPEAEAGAWANLGYVELQLGNLGPARDALDLSARLYESLGPDRKNLAVVHTWMARLAGQEGSKDKVMQEFIQASDHARAVQDSDQLAVICKEIARFYADQGDYRNAYDYLLLHDDIGEKAREDRQQRSLMELQVRYESEQKEEEADQLRAQAVELRLKAMRAQMNPHFLFNALNGIQHFINREDGEKASRYLAKFAGLVRQSLNLSNTELISLEEEVTFIRDYLYINQKLRFDGRLQFSVHVDEEIDEDRVLIPPMMVQPFVENAIEHGFIKRDAGRIEISFDLLEEDVIRCAIQDDGIGREEAIRLRSKDPHRESHHSLGIGITRERLDLLNRSGSAGHRLEILDLHDDQGQALGTRVELYFPSRRKPA